MQSFMLSSKCAQFFLLRPLLVTSARVPTIEPFSIEKEKHGVIHFVNLFELSVKVS